MFISEIVIIGPSLFVVFSITDFAFSLDISILSDIAETLSTSSAVE